MSGSVFLDTNIFVELTGRYLVSYYDTLVVAAAHLAGCAVVLSEDLSAGEEYGGVRVENPFLPSAR